MENSLKIFSNKEFGNVRCTTINDEPWFVGKDLIEALGYKLDDKNVASTYIKKFCDEDDYLLLDKNSLLNHKAVINYKELGQRGGYIVNESGMYALIFGSELPSAKRFKHWVTSEVLPDVRKHGIYATDSVLEKTLNNPDFMINLLQNYKEEKEARRIAEVKLEEQKPLVSFAETVANKAENIDMGDMAKLCAKEHIKIGRNRLFELLRDKDILMNNNIPFQRYIDNKWFEVVEVIKQTSYGEKNFCKTVVTGKGQIKIVELVRQEFAN